MPSPKPRHRPQPPAPSPKNPLDGFGYKLGELGSRLAGEVRRASAELTVGEIFELASRPVRHVCLFCGQEGQEPYGAALGSRCKERVKEAGLGVALRAGDAVQSLTLPELIQLVRAAKEAGFWQKEPRE